jgi:hypothetical protein
MEQVIPKRPYTLFLQSRCGYACGDHGSLVVSLCNDTKGTATRIRVR